jgi:stage II sporulation protein D
MSVLFSVQHSGFPVKGKDAMKFPAQGIGLSVFAARSTRLACACIFLALSFLPSGCGQNQNHAIAPAGAPIVRVLLLDNRPRVDLTATASPTLRVGAGQPRRLDFPRGTAIPVFYTNAGWKVGDSVLGPGELTIEPEVDGSVAVNARAFRGRYRFVPRGGGKFDVINDVDVDAYLKSVVSKELFWNWHDEAYRAQAIVARTYALYVSRTASEGTNFDLFSDTRSQVYGGISAETAKSRSAVDATRGMVVAYGPPGQEKIFKAYFSSCCGGVTQSAAAAFGDPPSVPLSEQNIGPRCAESPRFNWVPVVMTKREITRRMRLWGAMNNQPEKGIGDVARVDIRTNNRFGRPTSFLVTDARGYRYSVPCEDFRHALNTDATDGVTLPSSFFQPVTEPTSIRFANGHGFGHGAGLCQWCAQHQATAGVSHEQIVLGAFPHSTLVQAY